MSVEDTEVEYSSPHLLAESNEDIYYLGERCESFDSIVEEPDDDINIMDKTNDISASDILKNSHTRDLSTLSTTPFTLLLDDDDSENFLEYCVIRPNNATFFLEQEREKNVESQKIKSAKKILQQKNGPCHEQSNVLNDYPEVFRPLIQIDDEQLIHSGYTNGNNVANENISKSMVDLQNHSKTSAYQK